MYVLVVWFVVAVNAHSSGPAVNFQEFSSKKRCEEVLTIVCENSKSKYYNSEIRGICVEK